MKSRLTLLYLFTVLLLFGACAKNKRNPAPAPASGVPEVSTDTVAIISMFNAWLSGTITNTANGSVTECGFVISKNANPSVTAGMIYQVEAKSGNFSRTVDQLVPGTAYHARAYVRNTNGIAYGQEIVFTTLPGDAVVTKTPYNMDGISAQLVGQMKSSYNEALGSVQERGFVWSTNPGPTLESGESVIAGGTNPAFESNVGNLQPATTYYARAYARHFYGMSYGEEVTFRTAGYAGPSGGIVVLDKGANTGGWRYLEAAPEDISYSGSNLFSWGCTTSMVGGTSSDIGAGPDNTMRMLTNGCTYNYAAATRVDNYVYGSKTDWFLPASAESWHMLRTLNAVNNPVGTLYWTSTEVSQYNASVTALTPGGPYNMNKDESARVRAVRRY